MTLRVTQIAVLAAAFAVLSGEALKAVRYGDRAVAAPDMRLERIAQPFLAAGWRRMPAPQAPYGQIALAHADCPTPILVIDLAANVEMVPLLEQRHDADNVIVVQDGAVTSSPVAEWRLLNASARAWQALFGEPSARDLPLVAITPATATHCPLPLRHTANHNN